jgi:putative oxidoreductase
MRRLLNRQKAVEISFLALRIVAGLLFAMHGVQKLIGFPKPGRVEFGSQIWFGGMLELVCGVLIAVGLATRFAAFIASGTMAVAYFQFHQKLKLAGWHWLPSVNGGELAVIYCFLFLCFAASGGGRYSLDHALRGRI